MDGSDIGKGLWGEERRRGGGRDFRDPLECSLEAQPHLLSPVLQKHRGPGARGRGPGAGMPVSAAEDTGQGVWVSTMSGLGKRTALGVVGDAAEIRKLGTRRRHSRPVRNRSCSSKVAYEKLRAHRFPSSYIPAQRLHESIQAFWWDGRWDSGWARRTNGRDLGFKIVADGSGWQAQVWVGVYGRLRRPSLTPENEFPTSGPARTPSPHVPLRGEPRESATPSCVRQRGPRGLWTRRLATRQDMSGGGKLTLKLSCTFYPEIHKISFCPPPGRIWLPTAAQFGGNCVASM